MPFYMILILNFISIFFFFFFFLGGGGEGSKNEYFWGYEGFVDIISFGGGDGGHHKTGLVLWSISMHFKVFS